MRITRRRVLAGSTALAVAVAFAPVPAFAQEQPLSVRLMESGSLPEKAFGDPSAPVTVIEYASITCHHCQEFHKATWPAFKAKYVDTGKVRFIIREFPLDEMAAAGFMLARCSGDDKWYSVIDLLYQTGEGWGHHEKPFEALAQTMGQTGMSRQAFESCMRDEKLFQNIIATSRRGSEFGVTSTPTFFVNGQKYAGAPTLEQFDKLLEPLLATGATPSVQ